MANSETLNKSAAKAGLWYVLGNFLLKGCVFFTLPLFSRLLSTAEFGVYNTYLAYEGLITAVLGLGIYGTIKNAKIKYESTFNSYVSSALSLSLLLFTIAICVSNAFYPLYGDLIGFSRLAINLLILQSYSSALIQIYSSKLNVEFKFKSYLTISSIATLGNIALSLLFIFFILPNDKAFGRIAGSAIPLIAIGLYILLFSLAKGKKIFEIEYWKYSLRLGLPLIPHVISQSLLSQFDRIMITSMVGESESGIYSFVYTISTILVVFSTSLDNAWTPWVYMKNRDNKQSEVKKTSTYYVIFFAIMTLGFICISPEIAKLFGDKSYWPGIDLLVPLSLSHFFLFLYFLPVNIEYYHNKTLFISVGTVLAALINLGLNFIFIKLFGYKAAAYTTMASHLILFLFHCLIAKKYGARENYSYRNIFVISTVLIAISFGVLLLNDFVVVSLILRYSLIAAIIILSIFCVAYLSRLSIISAFKNYNMSKNTEHEETKIEQE